MGWYQRRVLFFFFFFFFLALTNEVSRKFGVGVYKLIFRLQESTWRSAAALPAAQRTVQRSDGAQANALGFTVLEIALVGVNPGARLICAARRAGSEGVGNRQQALHWEPRSQLAISKLGSPASK